MAASLVPEDIKGGQPRGAENQHSERADRDARGSGTPLNRHASRVLSGIPKGARRWLMPDDEMSSREVNEAAMACPDPPRR